MLAISGQSFRQADGTPFLVRGSTDFRLAECVLRGQDIQPILNDRMDAGANWFRVIGMKKNNTGWELNPRTPGYWSAVRGTLDHIGDARALCEWVLFADTKDLMPDPHEQDDHAEQTCDVLRDYPHALIEWVNEDKHATQRIDAQRFAKPDGILCSHGSGLSDVQPVKPFWDYATYHARRTGSIGKMLSNYSPYVFQDTFPTQVPFVPEESVKPEQYGFNWQVAAGMALHARCGAGGTLHHSAWNDPRPFNEGERGCAKAFYHALRD